MKFTGVVEVYSNEGFLTLIMGDGNVVHLPRNCERDQGHLVTVVGAGKVDIRLFEGADIVIES